MSPPKSPIARSIVNCVRYVPGPTRVVSGAACRRVCRQSTKMNPVHSPLIIEVFVFLNKLSEIGVSFTHLCHGNLTLRDDVNTMHEFAKVPPIFGGENRTKKRRTKAKYIEEIFCGLVST
jgi:hypothetical protein